MDRGKLTTIIAVVVLLASVAGQAIGQAADGEEIVTDEEALFGGGESDSSGGEASLFGSTASESDGASGNNATAEPSDDSLFSGPIVESIETTSGLDSTLLSSERVEIGGRYQFSAESSWTWNDPAALFASAAAPDADAASVDLGATLFFDARPDKDFRVFGKASISHPFTTDGAIRPFDEVLHVDELFSDFNWNDRVFLRGGKHTLNWGVGYFFSPADLLNVTEIDPEDPEADREGPVSLRVQVPISVHTMYAYAVANRIETWRDIGVAAKGEFVLGSAEVGIGALYQRDVAPSAMMTVTFPVRDVDLFAEGVLRYGSDRTWVEESPASPLGVAAVKRDDEWFYQLTAGLSFLYPFDNVDSSVSVFAQYLYNGEGYDDPTVLTNNADGVKTLFGAGELTPADLLTIGKHYAAANVGWNGIFGSDISLGAFWIHNFSDMSGSVAPSVSLSILERMSASVQVSYQYGEEGDEYTPAGDSLSASLRLSLGGGSF